MMEETWWNMPTSSSLYPCVNYSKPGTVHMPCVTVTSAHSHRVSTDSFSATLPLMIIEAEHGPIVKETSTSMIVGGRVPSVLMQHGT